MMSTLLYIHAHAQNGKVVERLISNNGCYGTATSKDLMCWSQVSWLRSRGHLAILWSVDYRLPFVWRRFFLYVLHIRPRRLTLPTVGLVFGCRDQRKTGGLWWHLTDSLPADYDFGFFWCVCVCTSNSVLIIIQLTLTYFTLSLLLKL